MEQVEREKAEERQRAEENVARETEIARLREALEQTTTAHETTVREQKERMAALESERNEAKAHLRQVSNELEDVKDERLCKICQAEEADYLLEPCGHLCVCGGACVQELMRRTRSENLGQCPLCRKDFTSYRKVFT